MAPGDDVGQHAPVRVVIHRLHATDQRGIEQATLKSVLEANIVRIEFLDEFGPAMDETLNPDPARQIVGVRVE